MHCSTAIIMHLLRAIAAVMLLVVALFTLPKGPIMVFALIGALLLLGGCPMCWLMGLVEKLKGNSVKNVI